MRASASCGTRHATPPHATPPSHDPNRPTPPRPHPTAAPRLPQVRPKLFPTQGATYDGSLTLYTLGPLSPPAGPDAPEGAWRVDERTWACSIRHGASTLEVRAKQVALVEPRDPSVLSAVLKRYVSTQYTVFKPMSATFFDERASREWGQTTPWGLIDRLGESVSLPRRLPRAAPPPRGAVRSALPRPDRGTPVRSPQEARAAPRGRWWARTSSAAAT